MPGQHRQGPPSWWRPALLFILAICVLPPSVRAGASDGPKRGSNVGASGAQAGSSASSAADGRSPVKRRPSLSDFMSKVGEVVKSPEFAELAENLNNIVEDVSGHRVDIQRGVMGVVQKADEVLGDFEQVAGQALKNYRSFHGQVDSVFRESFIKLIERGVRQLMTDRSIRASLQVVNATVVLVQEQMARAAPLLADPATRAETEWAILSHMARTAEDLEALGLSVVNSTTYRRMYPEDAPYYLNLLQSRLVPRLMLAVTCSLLHGLDPLSDPIYALLVVAFASGTLTKDLTAKLLAKLQVTVSGDMITEGWLLNRIPDVWRTDDAALAMGEGLNTLFRDLEEKEIIGGGDEAWRKGRSTRKGVLLVQASRGLALARRHGAQVVSVVVAVIAVMVVSKLLLAAKPGGRA